MRVDIIFPIVVFNGWTPFGKMPGQTNIGKNNHSISYVWMPYRMVVTTKKRR